MEGKSHTRRWVPHLKKNIKNEIKDMYLNENCDYLHEKTIYVINENIPFKELSAKELKRKTKPWVTKGILISMKKRTNSLNQFLHYF